MGTSGTKAAVDVHLFFTLIEIMLAGRKDLHLYSPHQRISPAREFGVTE
jgi:hypothetical protein